MTESSDEPEPRERRRRFGARHETVEEDKVEPELESKRVFRPFRHAEELESERDNEPENTIEKPAPLDLPEEARVEEAPALEPEPERKRVFRPFRHAERLEDEGDAPEKAATPEDETQSLPADTERAERRRRRRERRATESSDETEAAAGTVPVEIEIPLEPKAAKQKRARKSGPDRGGELDQAEPNNEAEPEPEPDERRRWLGARRERELSEQKEPQIEAEAAAQAEPERKRVFRPFRHAEEPEALESAMDTPALPGLREETAKIAAAEATAKVELPERISIREIEQTLDELGSRRQRERKRRWRFGTDAGKDAEEPSSAADAELEEALRLESEFRLDAERERRRREREYQRSLRS